MESTQFMKVYKKTDEETGEEIVSSTKILWDAVIREAEVQAMKYRQRIGSAPTLRGLFYALVSVEALPNTKSAYKGLSAKLADARKDGLFSWNLLEDKTRDITGGETRGYTLAELERRAEAEATDLVWNIKNNIENIISPSLWGYKAKIWDQQPKRVIIALEKDALANAVQNLTQKWKPEIFVMKGYSSTTYMKELADRIQDYNNQGLEVKLLILTDYDPSGEDIARHTDQEINLEFGVSCNAEKILLNKDQILRYELPARPEDAEERRKMARDPRFASWEDGFYRVELDAMMAIIPDEFERILNEEIEQEYDHDVRGDVERITEEIKEQAMERLEKLKAVFGTDAEEILTKLDKLTEELEEE